MHNFVSVVISVAQNCKKKKNKNTQKTKFPANRGIPRFLCKLSTGRFVQIQPTVTSLDDIVSLLNDGFGREKIKNISGNIITIRVFSILFFTKTECNRVVRVFNI